MKNIFLKKSLIVILISLIISVLIPQISGDILTINNFEYNKNYHYKNNCKELNIPNDFTSKDNIYMISDKFDVHNYSYFYDDSNNDPDNFKNFNFRKIEQINNFFIKNKVIYEDNDKPVFNKVLQKSLTHFSGNTFYVGGTGPNNYSSIQDAINDSEDGDTVFVFDDSSPYYENITIDKSINLIGENRDTTEINGSKLDDLLDTVNISADNVYINGFNINNNQGYYYQAAINIFGDYATVTNCKIHSNHWIGISLLDSSNSQIFDCELFNNLMAIHLVDSNENEIRTCYCYGNGEDIILFKNSNYNKIINCTCIGNSYSGIHVQWSTGNQIINCTCNNGSGGIGLAYAPNSIITGNTLNNNYENFGVGSSILSDFYCNIDTSNTINGKPIYYWVDHHNEQIPSNAGFIGLVSCTNISVKNLQISNNFQGIVIAGSSNCTIEDCNFLNNDGHGVYIISSHDNKITNCSNGNSFFSGIFLSSQSNSNIFLNNTITNNQVCGLWLENSVDNNICNNTIKNSLRGILLDKSGNSFLRNNNMENCGLAIDGAIISDYIHNIDTSNKINNKILYYYNDQNNLVIPGDAGEVILVNCTKCNVTNLDLSNGTIGVELAFSNYNHISGNIMNNNKLVAIDLDCESNNYNTIIQNTIIDNNYGIDIDLSHYNTIDDNNIKDNGVGLSFDFCTGNTISNNDIQNSYNGIYLSGSLNNHLNQNIIRNCDFSGIYLLFSKDNILKNNEMNNCGLLIYSYRMSEYINDVDTSNKINGKIIYYYINQNGIDVPSNAGEVILVNCSYCNVTNLDLSSGTIGVELAYSSYITISKNTLNNNNFAGIYIESSSYNTIERNTIKDNSYGIDLQLADNNKIKNNNIHKNSYGCYLYLSNINTLFGNNILYNNYGIMFNFPSDSNTIHHNNLIDNGYNAIDENDNANIWYHVKKGNYWGDYTKLYPNAKKILLKGIWNTPYEIPNQENKDEYPLIRPVILSKEKTGNLIFIRFLEKILDFIPCFNNT